MVPGIPRGFRESWCLIKKGGFIVGMINMTRTVSPLIEWGYGVYADGHGGWRISHHGMRLPDAFLTRQRAIAHVLTLIWPDARVGWNADIDRVTVSRTPVSLGAFSPDLIERGWFTTFPERGRPETEHLAWVHHAGHGILEPLSKLLDNRDVRDVNTVWACKPILNWRTS